jgi:hypothetical protein
MRTAEVLQACYDLLTVPSVTGLLSQAYGVPAVFQVGRVPRQDASDATLFPYITYSVPSDQDYSDKDSLGGNAIVQVDVWDRSGSALALGLIMRAALLETVRRKWNIPGFIDCAREASDPIPDPDGKTMHGIIRLRVVYLD